MKYDSNMNNRNIENIHKLIFVVISILVLFVLVIYGYESNRRSELNREINEFKATILVKPIAELENGPYIQIMVDTELRKICYINASGGGIACFDLDKTIEDKGPEFERKLIKKIRSQKSYYHQYNKYNNYLVKDSTKE